MATRVTREQFEVHQEVVIHRPTGARFVVHTPKQQPKMVQLKRCSFARGDYRQRAIIEVAKRLIQEQANRDESA